MKKKYIFIILFCLLLISIDFISKYLVINLISNKTIIIIKNFLKFLYVKNTGAAFGIMSGNIIILVIVTLILLFYIIKEVKNNVDNKWTLLSYLLILSGAIGNLIDRVFRGYVVDFISFTLFNKEMAVFNIADSYITIGVFLLIILLFKKEVPLWKK
jgi:signal peptidase II